MKINDDFELRLVGNDYFVVGEDLGSSDNITPIEESAAHVWEYVQERDFDENTIARILIKDFAYETITAETYASELINDWYEKGFIE